MTENSEPTKGSKYRYDDGTVEVVFAVEDDRVLTVREYPTRITFEDALARATYTGVYERVANLPDPAAFAGENDDVSDDGKGESDEA